MQDNLTSLGDYKIIPNTRKGGGFAYVYKAQTPTKKSKEYECEYVALKVLKPESERIPDLVKWFIDEGKKTIELKHNNIIKVYEAKNVNKYNYMAMEYIEKTLADKLAEDKYLSLAEAMHIIINIGDALNYAHKQNIIHCDVKPANILLDMKNLIIRPVLTDFGLYQLDKHGTRSTITDELTKSGGTKYYRSPEQWPPREKQGKNKQPSAATDIYALSIVFYEMLSGKHPFDGKTEVNFADAHRFWPRPSLSENIPSGKDKAGLKLGIEFDAVLKKSMAIESEHRYQTIETFMADLVEVKKKVCQKNVDAISTVFSPNDNNATLNSYLTKVNAVLENCPKFVEAKRLKAKIYNAKEDFENALKVYEEIYFENKDVSNLKDYLTTMLKVGNLYLDENEVEANKYYKKIKELSKDFSKDKEIQRIEGKATAQLVKQRIEKNISTLKEELNKCDNEECRLELYPLLDKVYEEVIDLDSQNEKKWIKERNGNSIAHIQSLLNLAYEAKEIGNVEKIIPYYNAITTLNKDDVSLSPDITTKIIDLETILEQYNAYNKIQKNINDGDFSKARKELDENFLEKGIFDYGEVQKMAVKLPYAIKHKNYPSDSIVPPDDIRVSIEETTPVVPNIEVVATTGGIYVILIIFILIGYWLDIISNLDSAIAITLMGEAFLIIVIIGFRMYKNKKG